MGLKHSPKLLRKCCFSPSLGKVTSWVSKTGRGIKATFGQCPKGSSFFGQLVTLTVNLALTFGKPPDVPTPLGKINPFLIQPFTSKICRTNQVI